jgi:predicted Zn-dependent protease with MMP-like domain
MIIISDDEFSDLIGQALDEMPADHMKAVQNVAIVYADDPTPEQRIQLQLRHDQTLFGLYEGVPLTARNGAIGSYGPDKITIFKHPITWSVDTIPALKEQIKHTVWHELAHYFGLNHDQIHKLEGDHGK